MQRLSSHAPLAVLALALLAAPVAVADRVVQSNEPVVISNDITDRSTQVRSAESTPANDEGDANDDNRSGLGDGTNPGQGDGTENSPNEGTDNPNNAGSGDGSSKPSSAGGKKK